MKFLSRFVDSNDRELRRIQPLIDEINELEPEIQALSADEIRERFALIRDDAAADPPGPGDSSREMQLEAHMVRIAGELHAAGLIPRLRRLPALTDEPRLGKLTSREWAVLTRLVDGQHIPAIAASLYVSQSTVRNHLTTIYRKVGVHSIFRQSQRTLRPHNHRFKAWMQ